MRYLKYLIIVIGMILCGCTNRIKSTERVGVDCSSKESSKVINEILDKFRSKGMIPVYISYRYSEDKELNIEIGGCHTNNINLIRTL